MKLITNKISNLDNLSKSMISSLFLDQIVRLNSIKDGAPLSQQMNIKHLLTKILMFIKSNPYSFFTINILETFRDDKNIKLSMTVKNFKYFSNDGTAPNRFHLFVSKNWDSFKVKVESIDGLLISIKHAK